MLGSYTYRLRENGIVVNIKKLNKVEIPKYAGAITARHISIEK